MARSKQVDSTQQRKLELLEQLEASRMAMTYGREVLKEQVNVKKRVKRSFARHQNKFVMGSAVLGGLLASIILKKRSKKVQQKKSVGGWVKGLIIGAVVKRIKTKAIDRAKIVLMDQIQKRNSQ